VSGQRAAVAIVREQHACFALILADEPPSTGGPDGPLGELDYSARPNASGGGGRLDADLGVK
jgi:hypothetical protein